MGVDADSDDDSLLNGRPAFSRPKRSCRANPEEKKDQDGFARLHQALDFSGRKIQREDDVRRIKMEGPDFTDGESNLAKVESIAQLASTKKPKTTLNEWLVDADDNDGVVRMKELIARASAKNTYGACKTGTIAVFKRAEATDVSSKIDPYALLEKCLKQIESTHNKQLSQTNKEIVRRLRAAMKGNLVAEFLESGFFERHAPPQELVQWLYQVAMFEPCQGIENNAIREQAVSVITNLWKNATQGCPLTTKRLNISDLVPQLERITRGPMLELNLAMFLRIWVHSLRGGGVGISPGANVGEVVRSCVVALVRVGLDDVFHHFDASRLFAHLQDLICALIDLVFTRGQCDDDWIKQTAEHALRDENLAPVDKVDTNDSEEPNTTCLTLALAVEIIPYESSDHRVHRSAARLKAFLAMRALQIMLHVPEWETKVQSSLALSAETANLADQVKRLTFASALVAAKGLYNDSDAFEKDGPLIVSVLQIILMCWKTACALSEDEQEAESLMCLLYLFEPHLTALSQIAQRSKFDWHFQNAAHKLDLLKRHCQTYRTKSVTPSPVKIQKTMFDFLKASSTPTESESSPAPSQVDAATSPTPVSAAEAAASPLPPFVKDEVANVNSLKPMDVTATATSS